ncbi:type IX secretion system sortase PorU [Paucihalobacter ruber]|uniref:Type IX secretion system sortase PorU n=1 Tax=Paucihalobacter ruber TaxID=2567861 RepID=A0A506PLN2_9FLAO|nr:type IX secretion system sortase PorU [Paucihalobacter ruber]TPV34225.1 type IX secretion system sortase PorU [Paucihalobacter ruber]
MKKILLSFALLYTLFGNAQQRQFDINWSEPKVLETELSRIELPSFDDNHFSYNDEKGLIYFAQWESGQIIDEDNVQVNNIVYENISEADLKQMPKNLIPDNPNLYLKNATDRNKNYIYLEISPIVRDNGVLKRIRSFTVTYNNLTQNRSLQSTLSFNRSNQLTNSVLRTGQWYRFYVTESGVYKLSRSFLNSLGVNTNNVNPRNIKIFGNGGRMLPLLNSEDYPIDLTENAIKIIGEEDGRFDNSDYIIFYAEGTKGYSNESDTHNNIYTDRSYYYVNVSSGEGKRIQSALQPESPANLTVNTFDDYQFHELDEFNLVKLGRRWYGDRFDIETERNFEFNFSNLVSSEPVNFSIKAAAVSVQTSSMAFSVNGELAANLNFSLIAPGSSILASGSSFTGIINPSSDNITVNVAYNNNGIPTATGYIDYIGIQATRALTYTGDQLFFTKNIVANIGGIVEYQLGNTQNISEVWDITDRFNVTSYQNTNNSASFSFKAQAGTSKNYLVFGNNNFLDPFRENSAQVANQDLKGSIFLNQQGQFQDVDYLIITPDAFSSQAQRLADINKNVYNLNVKVVRLSQIYLEFSSGNQDIAAIRNFIRYVYHNASSPENRVKYVCLFGDGSYDYKNRLPNNTNFVPSWYALESFSLTSSFVSDDFYGMMDPNEGTLAPNNRLDLAVGRILADSPQRARELVDKIAEYHSRDSFGGWRNNVIMISDDVDESWERILQGTTDEIGNSITAQNPFFNVVKIHADAFQQASSSAGDRYPEVNTVIKNAIEVGAILVNYFGHGGEDFLAKERIFDKNDAQSINNQCKYNCFVTITCEYTKFDDPGRPTAGEFTYWNKTGGAISLVTTTRQIFVSVGVSYNVVFSDYIFRKIDGEYPSIAEALRLTKIDPAVAGISQKRLVFYIGDPAMKLSIPKPEIRLTQINDVPVNENTTVLQALGYTKLSGQVYDELGNPLTNYNGTLSATVYDKPIQRQTLANDGVRLGNELIKLDFETLGQVLFRGQASVTNGTFDFDFIVPRDIQIPVGAGKVSFYAVDNAVTLDKTGYSFDINVGGINQNAAEDNIGPLINLFMNDENFVTGGITNESPTLLAKLQDDSGINTASGIGHDIIAILDGDVANPFILNNYYQANVDDFQRGTVSFPFRDLEPGPHTLTFRAWDVYNNSSTAELEFVVFDQNEVLRIENVLNYPNPFVNYTEFWFNHNSSEPLDVSVQIFTVSGKLVRTLNGQTSGGNKSTSSLSKDIVWDGRDDFGDKIGKGVYVYKLTVRSNTLNKEVEKFEKLVILQ